MTDKQLSKQTTASKHLPVRMPQASQSAASELTSHELQAAVENPAGAPPAHLLALQRKFGNRAVGKAIQRAAAVGMEGGAVDTRTHSAIQSERGGGAPLDANVGAQVGNALGADFSGVKVHTDAKADSLNRTLSATAFTLGSDIFFSQGAYSPGTSGGQELLAHELTHVVQQGGGSRNKVQAKLTVGAAGDRYEQEADRFASKFSKRTSATPAVSTYAVARAPAGYRSGCDRRGSHPAEDWLRIRRQL